MKKLLLFVLTLLTFSACGSDDSVPSYETTVDSFFDSDEIYKTYGCRVNDASLLLSLRPVLVDDNGYRYLTGSINVNDNEVFWFAKFKPNGDCIWETIQQPAAAKGYTTKGLNPIVLANGYIMVACVVTSESGALSLPREMIPTILNTNTGSATFVKVKDGYIFSEVKLFDDFFMCKISIKEMDLNPNAYPWIAQISNDGKLLLSAEAINWVGEYNLLLNSSEFITANHLRIERNTWAITNGVGPKWSYPILLPEHKSYQAKIEKEGTNVKLTYTLTLPDDNIKQIRYKLDIETGNDFKVINDIDFQTKSLVIQENDTYTLQVNLTPKDTPDKEMIWKSSDESIATVNSRGVLTAKKVGKCSITVKSTVYDEVFDICELEVIAPADLIVIIDNKINLLEGDEHQVEYKLYPIGATHTVTWETEDSSIATVDQNGKVTSHANGTTRVKASINNGEIVSECVVNVVSIEKYMSVSFGFYGGSIINGYASGIFETGLSNRSTKVVQIKNIQVKNLSGSVVLFQSLNNDLNPMEQIRLKMTFPIPVYYPSFIWTYTYNGKEYQSKFNFGY